ncbi:MAG: hypothetical protein CUN56_07170 [Phototrophicales bacterium]|nr:MAG: hypothetical protein CUN56_07170 [Phototrophicales bacterium]RMG77190.1 MAG: hypothetical protein D6711_02155 [Chloroflexota bacterium]
MVTEIVIQGSLLILVGLLVVCAWRVIVGPSPADRLQGVDTSTSVLLGIIVLLSLIQGNSNLLDVALALAAFGFVGTVAIARYLSEGRMF